MHNGIHLDLHSLCTHSIWSISAYLMKWRIKDDQHVSTASPSSIKSLQLQLSTVALCRRLNPVIYFYLPKWISSNVHGHAGKDIHTATGNQLYHIYNKSSIYISCWFPSDLLKLVAYGLHNASFMQCIVYCKS